MLLARAVVLLPRKMLQFGAVTILVLFSLVDLFVIKQYYWRPQKEQFREAVAYVKEKATTTPHALVVGCVWNKEYLNYYFAKLDSELRVDLVAGKHKDILSLEELIKKRQSKEFWYIRAHRMPKNGFLHYIKGKFTIMSRATFVGADVWLLRLK